MSDVENKEVQATEPVAQSAEVPAAAMADDKMMAELNKYSRKQLFWQRIASLAVLGIFAVILIAALVVIPRVLVTLYNVNQVLSDATESLEQINGMVSEMTTASKNLNELVNENAGPLTEAVKNMSNVDFDGLNKAITDLQDTVGPMASFFNKFR